MYVLFTILYHGHVTRSKPCQVWWLPRSELALSLAFCRGSSVFYESFSMAITASLPAVGYFAPNMEAYPFHGRLQSSTVFSSHTTSTFLDGFFMRGVLAPSFRGRSKRWQTCKMGMARNMERDVEQQRRASSVESGR